MNNNKNTGVPQVQDILAENRIKWGVIAQSLILLMVSAIGIISFSFGGRVLDSMDKINDTLIEVKEEISDLNTGVQVNSTRIESHSFRIKNNEEAIRSLSRIIP